MKTINQQIRNSLTVLVLLVATPLLTVVGIAARLWRWLFSLNDQALWSHLCNRIWARLLVFVTGVRVRVEGIERIPLDRPVVFACNHLSTADIPVLLGYLPANFRFVAKRSLFRLLPAMIVAKYIPVTRDRTGRDWQRVLQEGLDAFRCRASVLFFAEGQRSRDGQLGQFRSGAFRLAVAGNVTVVPIVVKGTNHIMPPGSLFTCPGNVTVQVLEPVECNDAEPDAINFLSTRVRASMLEALATEQSITKSPPALLQLHVRNNKAKTDELEQVRTLLPRVRAMVIDLDKCLLGGYAGIDVLLRLVFTGRSSLIALIAWFVAALRLRWTLSGKDRWLPQSWRMDRFTFQTQTLGLELTTSAEDLSREVSASMVRVERYLRRDLVELVTEASSRGVLVILATANSWTFAEPISRRVGITEVVCSRIDRVTGRSELAVGEQKLQLVLDHLARYGISAKETLAIADLDWSGNDIPLLTAMGFSVQLVNVRGQAKDLKIPLKQINSLPKIGTI